MAHIIYFSSVIEPNGEIKLIRRDEEVDFKPSPMRVDIIVRDAPTNTDPTLAVFHEPHKDKRNA